MRHTKRRGGAERINYSPAPNRNNPPKSNLQNQMITFNGYKGYVIGVYKVIMASANDDIYMSTKQPLSERPKYIARATEFKAIAQRIREECEKPDGTLDAINAILTENNLQFKNDELVKTNLAIKGGRIKKVKTRKYGKSRKSRKNKTRRR